MIKHAWIGMSKSGSTSLSYILNPVLKELNIKSNINEINLKNLTNFHRNSLELGIDHDVNINDYYNEYVIIKNLISDDPEHYEYNAERNLNFFSKDTKIFIIFRDPNEYFQSLFYQRGYGRGAILKEKHFFLFENSYTSRILNNINFEKFSYKKIVNIYNLKFKEVKIFFLSDFFDNKYLEHIYKVDNINRNIKLRKRNKFSYYIFQKLNYYLKLLNVSYKTDFFENNLIEEYFVLKNKLIETGFLEKKSEIFNNKIFEKKYKSKLEDITSEYEELIEKNKLFKK